MSAKSMPSFDYPSANSRLYTIAEGVTASNIADALDGKFALLDAMLLQTTGEQGESFRCYSDDIQDSYLYGCNQLAREIHEFYRQLKAMAF